MQLRLLIIIIVSIIAPLCVNGQTEWFSDNFNNADMWQQDSKNFISEENYLYDTSSTQGTNIIYRNIDYLYPEDGDITLIFNIKCGYDNSSVNNFQVYLIANGQNPDDENFRGFAIGTGYKPNYKNISLLYNEGGNIKVLSSTEITVTKKELTITATRSSSGVWSINQQEIFTEDNLNFQKASHIVTAFNFTKTGAQKFRISFTKLSQNTNANNQKSTIDSAKFIDNQTVRLFINGRIKGNYINDLSHFAIDGQNPISLENYFYYVNLKFSNSFNSGTIHELIVDNLLDVKGFQIETFKQNLIQSGENQIIINEIMIDINPSPYALPNAKYVELFNVSPYDFDLEGYHFHINDLEYEMPATTLKTGEYMIICNNASQFAQYGKTADILIDSKLTISSKTLTISNKFGETIDQVTYSDKFYNDPTRNQGGFSMERRDPENNCNGQLNWLASSDISGGTPGRINSAYQIYIDQSAPTISTYKTLETNKFQIEFSENIQSLTALLNGLPPSNIEIYGTTATLIFNNSIKNGTNEITISATDVCQTQGETETINIDYQPFAVTGAYAVSSYQVVLTFSTDLYQVSTDNFVLSNGAIPILCEFTSDGKKDLLLTFADDFEDGKKYSITTQNLSNEINETIQNHQEKFKYHKISPNDLIINEIMYYPRSGEKRFVELLNISGNDIFLYGTILRHHTADMKTTKQCMVTSHIIIHDGEYVALTADTANLVESYKTHGEILVQCNNFPALNNTKGYVALISQDGETLDSTYYEKSMHSNILSDVRGVSLERISAQESSLDPKNWISASASTGYATPGLKNSASKDQSSTDENKQETQIPNDDYSVENQLITTDNPLTITLNIPKDETMISASAFDDNGRKLRTLASEIICYPGITIEWDGKDSGGNNCRTGIYVILIKATSAHGWKKNYKIACAIGRRR